MDMIAIIIIGVVLFYAGCIALVECETRAYEAREREREARETEAREAEAREAEAAQAIAENEPARQPKLRKMTLIKGEETYIFRYSDDCRSDMLLTLGRFASNEELSFTWYDAAVLAEHVREGRKSVA